jgi:hypothetical protein
MLAGRRAVMQPTAEHRHFDPLAGLRLLARFVRTQCEPVPGGVSFWLRREGLRTPQHVLRRNKKPRTKPPFLLIRPLRVTPLCAWPPRSTQERLSRRASQQQVSLLRSPAPHLRRICKVSDLIPELQIRVGLRASVLDLCLELNIDSSPAPDIASKKTERSNRPKPKPALVPTDTSIASAVVTTLAVDDGLLIHRRAKALDERDRGHATRSIHL